MLRNRSVASSLGGWGGGAVGKHCLGSRLAVTKTYRSELIQHEQQRDVTPEPRSKAAVVAWELVVARPMHVRPHVADGFPDVTVFVCPCQQGGLARPAPTVSFFVYKKKREGGQTETKREDVPDVDNVQPVLDLLGQVLDVLAV